MEPQQQSDTDSHVTISGEVAVNLQSISVKPHQVLNSRIESGIVKDTLYKVDTDIVARQRAVFVSAG